MKRTRNAAWLTSCLLAICLFAPVPPGRAQVQMPSSVFANGGGGGTGISWFFASSPTPRASLRRRLITRLKKRE